MHFYLLLTMLMCLTLQNGLRHSNMFDLMILQILLLRTVQIFLYRRYTFNLSLSQQLFPPSWKQAVIVPIKKKPQLLAS